MDGSSIQSKKKVFLTTLPSSKTKTAFLSLPTWSLHTSFEHQLSTDRSHSSLGHLFNLKEGFSNNITVFKTKTAFLSFPIQGLNTSFEHQSGTDRSHPWMGHLFKPKRKALQPFFLSTRYS